MKLAYVTLQATQEGQAAHAHVHEIVRGLQRRGVDVTLFEPDYGSNHNPTPFRRLLEFARIQLKALRGLRQFDGVYVRNHFAALPLVLMAKLAGVPTVQEINGPWEEVPVSYPRMQKLMPIVRWIMRAQFRLANALIGVTPQLATWASRESGNKVPSFVVPNGANTDLFHPDASGIVNVPSPYAIFFGALSPWQGIQTLLAAAAHDDWPEQVRLVIAGTGAEEERVRRAVSQRVIYLGKVPYRELPALVAGAIASLIPKNSVCAFSNTGLAPLKIYESLACGTPVVVSDFPGMADIVRETSTGIVIPSEDAAALARAVATLHRSPLSRQEMGVRARQVAVERHSWDKRAADTLHILETAFVSRSNSSALESLPTSDRAVAP